MPKKKRKNNDLVASSISLFFGMGITNQVANTIPASATRASVQTSSNQAFRLGGAGLPLMATGNLISNLKKLEKKSKR